MNIKNKLKHFFKEESENIASSVKSVLVIGEDAKVINTIRSTHFRVNFIYTKKNYNKYTLKYRN